MKFIINSILKQEFGYESNISPGKKRTCGIVGEAKKPE